MLKKKLKFSQQYINQNTKLGVKEVFGITQLLIQEQLWNLVCPEKKKSEPTVTEIKSSKFYLSFLMCSNHFMMTVVIPTVWTGTVWSRTHQQSGTSLGDSSSWQHKHSELGQSGRTCSIGTSVRTLGRMFRKYQGHRVIIVHQDKPNVNSY